MSCDITQAACASCCSHQTYNVQQIALERMAQAYMFALCQNCSNPELKDQINRLKDTAGSLRQQ